MAIFAAVADAGSFTAAGEFLGMPRGKVSEQVARLEDYLGVKLFIRSTRKMSITAEGEALHQHVQQLLPSALAGVEEVKSYAAEIKGRIRITTTHDVYEYHLLPVLKAFRQQYPQVKFDLIITQESVPIIENAIDLAIRSGDMPDSALISRPLFDTRLKLYASPQLAEQIPVQPEQLAQLDWVTLAGVPNAALSLRHKDGSQLLVTPGLHHQTSGLASYMQLLEQGFGVGVLPENSGRYLVEQGKLMPVLDDWYFDTLLRVSLVYPARLHMAQRTRLLIDAITSSVRSA